MATQFSQFPAFLVKPNKREIPNKKRKSSQIQDNRKVKRELERNGYTESDILSETDQDVVLIRTNQDEKGFSSPELTNNEFEVPDPDLPSSNHTTEAITQTSNEFMVSKEVQTDITCLKNGSSSEDWCRAERQNVTACGYKAMYSLSKQNGDNPPLKLGLTLPKNRVRRVFYPGLENNGVDSD